MDRRFLDISWVTLWRIFFFVALAAVLFLGRQIILGLFLAVVISSGLEFLVDFLERRGIPRTLGVVLIFLISTLIILIVAYALIPFVIADVNTLLQSVDQSTARYWLAPLMNSGTDRSVEIFITRLSGQLFSGQLFPIAAFSGIVGSLGLAVAVVFSSFYLSINREGVEKFIRSVFPADYEEMALRIYSRSRRKIGSWFRTQILLSITMGVLAWVALIILGVKHAFLLAILSGVFELVPFVGPILSGAAAVIAALAASPLLAVYTLIVFLAIHQFESHVLVPLLTYRTVGLHPVVVITSLLVGARAGGFLGIVIAVPAAAVLQEILDEWSEKKRVRAAP